MQAYRTIKGRITSRFIKYNVLYGRLFLVSSKKSEHDFLESYVKEVQNGQDGDKMLVVDEPQWVIKPEGTFDKRTFPVAVGNRSLKSRVLPEGTSEEELEALVKQGYRIIHVPINYRQEFNMDVNAALMDKAGISVWGAVSFFNLDMFSKCYVKDYKNPFETDILTMGMYDDLRIQDFFKIDQIPMKVRSMPQFIHIDAALTGDKAGISDVGVSGLKEYMKYDGADESMVSEMTYKHIFSVDIKSPQGSEISFEKTRQFIYYLRSKGFNIVGVSLDGYQSADTKQLLIAQGFDATIISLDRSPDGYITLRSAMNDGRIGLIHIDLLETELVQLQRDVKSGKLDHPQNGCFTDDTCIALVDGRTLTIKELLYEQAYKDNYVYTVNEETHVIEPKRIKKIFKTKYVETLLQVMLSNGITLECTEDHRFMLNDCTFKEAQYLTESDNLMCNGKMIHVVSTSVVNKQCAVYDLEIEDNHNFALAAGVFVHNSKDMADSLAGAFYNATVHKQSLIDAMQLFSSSLDVNADESFESEFMGNLQASMSGGNTMTKLASDKLDELLNGYGGGNLISW